MSLHVLESLASTIRQEKRNKVKLFADSIILCVENSKEATKTIANTRVQQGFRIHYQSTKSIVFSCARDKETHVGTMNTFYLP